MKTLAAIAFTVLLISASAFPFPLKAGLQQQKLTAENFEGYFELQGRAPKGLEGFKGITLTTVRFTPNGAVPVKPHGEVNTAGRYKMTRVSIDGANLSFETLALRGVSYEFTGALHQGSRTDPNALILKGTLTKNLNGKKIAESGITLEYVEGVD